MAKRNPVIGNWYQDVVEDQIFEVVAIDEDTDDIAIQYLDGDISEIDLDTWRQMVLLPAEPPDDIREFEDLAVDENDPSHRELGWEDPFNELEPDSYPGYDEY